MPFTAQDPLSLDDSLDTAERTIRDNVAAFCRNEIAPHITQWFEHGNPPVTELATQLGELGVFGMHLDGYGCAGTNAVSYGLACMELEACDSGIRSLVSVQGSLAMYAIWRYGSHTQKRQWLPDMAAGRVIGCFGLTEPDHGSDPSAMTTTATKNGDDWILNGRKTWITNGCASKVAVVWAKTADGVQGFVVPTDTPGFTTNPITRKMSLRASVTSELVLDNVRLPADAALPDATGLKTALACLNEARYGIIWGSIGAARSSLDTAREYASMRTQFDRPIAGFQLTQNKLVDMTLKVHNGLLLALHLGRLKDNQQLTPHQVSYGKLNNTRDAIDVCRQARTILGANGVSLDYDVIRHANNLESVLTYEGTAEMHTLILGQGITGHNAFRG